MNENTSPAEQAYYQQKLNAFSDLTKEWFGECETIEDFVSTFNQVIDGYLQGPMARKLNPDVIKSERVISCTGAAVMAALFVEQKLPDRKFLFLVLDPKIDSHIMLAIYNPQEFPEPTDFTSYIQELINEPDASQDRISPLQRESVSIVHFKESKSDTPYKMSKLRNHFMAGFKFGYDDILEFIQDREKLDADSPQA